ncbi:hypothetical protein BSPWISOXPB_4359 [uncultured Gammaproteobacteria bacterium]|nr:hypothetical protein BSPWISOXPB_4359 [uncultured Gammaproteobacteria bacterium]
MRIKGDKINGTTSQNNREKKLKGTYRKDQDRKPH